MYIAEISTANIRGSLISLQQLAIAVGVSETTSYGSYASNADQKNSSLWDVCRILYLHIFVYAYHLKTGLRMSLHILGESNALLESPTLDLFLMAFLHSTLITTFLVAAALVKHKHHGEFRLDCNYSPPWHVDYVFVSSLYL